MLNIRDKIYYIDYKESGASYTIKGIFEVKDNPVMKDGLYYNVHSDRLPPETGYYPIKVDCVDTKISRFFSTIDNAKQAYLKHLNR